MKIISFIICALIGVLLISAAGDFPDFGDVNSPANTHLSSYYLENSIKQTDVPNVVSALLADYRGFDTMLETCVVLIAAVAIIFLLRRSGFDKDHLPLETSSFAFDNNLILQTTCRMLIPVMQLYALYVIIHGHHSPGGGFQGGVILGAVLILHSMVFGLKKSLSSITEIKQRFFNHLGVLIFALVGLTCLILGGNFLDYSQLSKILPVDPVYARSLGILFVEVGVAMTVMTVMFSIYADLSSSGEMDKGV